MFVNFIRPQSPSVGTAKPVVTLAQSYTEQIVFGKRAKLGLQCDHFGQSSGLSGKRHIHLNNRRCLAGQRDTRIDLSREKRGVHFPYPQPAQPF